jgi:putative ABC transport system substrate-binding protein
MRRREFIGLIGSVIVWLRSADAQQTRKVPRIGLLNPGPSESPTVHGFYQGMRELGYLEGQNMIMERRYGDWNSDRFPVLASELVRLKVDVIVVMSTSPARAVKQATTTIPIVAVSMADPVGDELVASLARPGGNITGTTFLGPELIAKRLGLLQEAIPGLLRVTALWHPEAYGSRTMQGILKETEVAATGVQLQLVPVHGPDDFENAFSAMTRAHTDALIVLPSPMLFTEHRRIVDLAAGNRLPANYNAREFVDAGGLMSYGANQRDLGRRSATYVDKILKGAKPADLPVEQPTKFELLVNLKTARELGLTIPREFLLLADEVIE